MAYEIREYQGQKDIQHHIDVYEDGNLKSSFIWDGEGQVWLNEKTQEGIIGDAEQEVYGDLDEYEITENNCYGVKSTYYTLGA